MDYITQGFPDDWTCVVEVVDDATGRDDNGQPVKATVHTVPDCLVGPATTKDLQDFSDAPREMVTLQGPPSMPVKPTSRIVVPRSHYMAGVYKVSGRPGFWPLGTTVPMQWVRELKAGEGDG